MPDSPRSPTARADGSDRERLDAVISRPVKILLLFAVLLIASIAAVLAGRSIASGWLEKQIVTAVRRGTGADCSIGLLRIGLIGGIRMESVRISEAGADSPPLLAITQIRIHSPLPEWLRSGRLFISIRVDTVSVDVRRIGRLSGTEDRPESGASLPAVGGRFPMNAEIRLRFLCVHEGRPDSCLASMDGMVLRAARPASDPSVSFRATADTIRVFLNQTAVSINRPVLNGMMDSSAVTIGSCEAEIPGGRMTAEGRIAPLGRDWRMHGGLTFRTAVESWPRRLIEGPRRKQRSITRNLDDGRRPASRDQAISCLLVEGKRRGIRPVGAARSPFSNHPENWNQNNRASGRPIENADVQVPVSGIVEGRLNADCSLRRPVVTWNVEAAGLSFRSGVIQNIRSSGVWNGDSVVLDAFSLTAGAGSVSGSGMWTFRGSRRARLSASFRQMDIPFLSGWFMSSDAPVRGALSGDIRIDAFPDDPGRLSATSTVAAENLKISGRPLDPLRLDLDIGNGRADVRITGKGLSASLEGVWPPISSGSSVSSFSSFSSGGAFSVRLDDSFAAVFLPEGWTAAGPAGITGLYRVHGETAEAEADFTVAGIRTAAWALDSLAGPLRFRLEFRSRSWSAEGADILCAARAFRTEDTLKMGGRIRMAASLIPGDGHPSGSLRMAVRPLSIGGMTADSVFLDAGLEHRMLRINRFSYTPDSNTIDLTGWIPVGPDRYGSWKPDPTKPFDLRLTGQDIRLEPLRPFLPGSLRIGGLSTFDLRITGTLADPTLDGRWSGLRASFRGTGIPEIDSVSWAAVFLDSTVRIESLAGRVNGIPLALSSDIGYTLGEKPFLAGTASFLRPAGIRSGFFFASDSMRGSLTVDSLHLALLDSLFPESSPVKNMSGVVRADLAFSVRPGSPLLTGRLSGSGLNFTAAGTELGAGNGRLSVRFARDTIAVDTLSLPVLGGSADVRGRLRHKGGRLSAWNLNAELRNIRIREPGRLTCAVDRSRLSLVRDAASNRLTGEIILGECRYLQTMKASDFLSMTRSPARTSSPLPDEVRDMALNVRITGGREVWIDNNLARVRFQPELAVSGRVSNPELTGRLTTHEGTVQYLDHAFTLKKGTADFATAGRINPILDIEAEARLRNYQTYSGTPYVVTLTLQGPLDQADFVLASVPQASRTDILSLLTFGATRDELNRTLPSSDRNGGMSDVLMERAKSLSSRRVASTAENYMGTLFQLDSMSIEGNLFRFDKEWGPRLQASKRVSRRVALNYSTTVGHMNEESVRLNVWIDRRFSVEGQVDRIGRSGIDLKYKIKFQ
ncbi:translocation/assembly module TamB domain-containing protein [bacterium]|nr:translocation/assembly module TamB domain-containing protein [bacterium]